MVDLYAHRENMLFPVSLSVHPAFSGTFFDLTVRRRMSGHFGSERAQTVQLSLSFFGVKRRDRRDCEV